MTATQEKLTELDLVSPIIGHVGDGNFHTVLLFDPNSDQDRARAKEFVAWLNTLALSMEGTCTGEHGVGQGKKSYIQDELGDAVEIMKTIKQAIDPQNIMNPGKII